MQSELSIKVFQQALLKSLKIKKTPPQETENVLMTARMNKLQNKAERTEPTQLSA